MIAFLFLTFVFGVVAIVTPHKPETILSIIACFISLGLFLWTTKKRQRPNR